MKKMNLLSKAEMRKVMGGDAPVGGEGGRCNQKICSFESAGQGEVTGYCGLSMDGEQCRCIYNGGDPGQPTPASVPDEFCLA